MSIPAGVYKMPKSIKWLILTNYDSAEFEEKLEEWREKHPNCVHFTSDFDDEGQKTLFLSEEPSCLMHFRENDVRVSFLTIIPDGDDKVLILA